jgi:GNAT superfamily N-acetyltransferase
MIDLRRATPADAPAIAEVYLASFRAAMPSIRLAHTDAEVRGWIRDHVVTQLEAWVAVDGAGIVAILVLSPGWVEQLYVAPDRQGEGIGRRLLDLAKARSAGALQLRAFQVNDLARRFYQRNGFSAVELTDGAGNEEREPDVRYRWEADATPS